MNVFMQCLHWPLADGGGENAQSIFWLIVTVVVVISQILKANKKSGAKSPAAAPGERTAEKGPGEELRRFLESLGGSARPTPAAPTKQQPPPLDTAKRAAVRKVTNRQPAARSATYPKAKSAAYAIARPGAGPSRKRVPPLASPTPHAPELPDAWKKPRKAAFQHFKHSEDLGVKADTRNENMQQLIKGVGDDLIGKDHLRKAMVLKEILGPPLALRNPAAS